ncbi:choice-of-anchor G family protein [Cryobacterium sp. CG_9.6]|uniref:choice-of-anchor G family protein n=1 Tax=Cryobacterium sp. CG_9.6 TaxID=2760710 RepID=UPI002475F709|nr:choice-of-anchor G family protein [Cryobacterium sp. CG_9.6]MDH6235780.1 hypothetical protein [Cryobacterium sp. CG_9.6]
MGLTSPGLRVGSVVAITALFLGAGSVPAMAAPGDISNAAGQFISGTLVGQDLALVAALAGETATSDGITSQTNANNLDLTALGTVNIDIGGGVLVPLDLASAGVVYQFAQALNNASSRGSSGAVGSDGIIGTAPNAGVAPGPLTLDLSQVVANLGLPGIAELANLNLTVGAVAGSAAQAAPAAAVGGYNIASAQLTFTSPTIAGITGATATSTAAVQAQLDVLNADLTAALDAQFQLLDPLAITTLAVTAPDLAAVTAGLTTGTVTNIAFPGVSINLDTGEVTIDLDALTGGLNGLPPNTSILTPAVLTLIETSILGVLTGVTDSVQAAITAAVDATAITGDVSVLGVPILTVNTTVGALKVADTSGLVLAGVGLALPGGVASVLTALLPPITALQTTTDALSTDVLAPVLASLNPAISAVLGEALAIIVNNQSLVAGVFTETALRVTVLPNTSALALDLGTGQVGVNALAVAAGATALIPDNGPETGGTAVTVTGSGFTGATGLTVDGTSVPFVVVDDATITFTTPVHAPGLVDVVVVDPAGNSAPLGFTFTLVAQVITVTPNTGPEAGANTVTITGVCFTSATSLLFGATPATSFVVVNDTTITAVVPAGTGLVDVTVTGGGTCGTGTLPGAYTFLPAAAITGIVADNGPQTGGTTVVITGTGFTGTTDVTFNGTSVPSFTVDSDTQITVTTPAHAPGQVDVVVLSANGNSPPALFTFTPVTTATGVDPSSGPAVGGTTVTITGSCFTGATSVLFGGTAASFTVLSDTQIMATSPAGSSTVDVTVVGGGTCGTGILVGAFRYVPATVTTTTVTPPSFLASTGFGGMPIARFGVLLLLLAGVVLLIVRRRRDLLA